MRSSLSAAFMLLLATASPNSEHLPVIGAKFEKSWAANQQRQECLTQLAQFDVCAEHTFDGIKFQVAYSQQADTVTHLYTEDKRFQTADGLKVGDSIPITPEALIVFPGWRIYGPETKDGWHPILG